jgi:hypothetical protein
MGDRRARDCSSCRSWRRGLAIRWWFHFTGKGRAASPPIAGGAGLRKMGLCDQPALFAVAQGIVKNDPEAIRTAAKSVPDLQAPGRNGRNVAQLRCETIVAATRISRRS